MTFAWNWKVAGAAIAVLSIALIAAVAAIGLAPNAFTATTPDEVTGELNDQNSRRDNLQTIGQENHLSLKILGAGLFGAAGAAALGNVAQGLVERQLKEGR